MADSYEIGPAEEKKTPDPALAPKEETPEEQEQKIKEDEEKKKAEQLVNLNKAISEANEELARIRLQKKEAKTANSEEELPKIDFDDPASKAWDKHITDKVIPVSQEMEKEKAEIRTFAIQEFLADKPALSTNPEKVKELVSTYERIRTATERTKEGVLVDLGKAYGAIYYEESLARARAEKADKVRQEEAYSDIAISRGATAYSDKQPRKPQMSEEDKKIVEKWDDSLKRIGINMDK